MFDFTGEVLNEVTVPLAEKPIYTAPITLTNGNRHKNEIKMKVRAFTNPSVPSTTWLDFCSLTL